MKFPSDVHIDQVLTNFAVNYANKQDAFIATKVAPVLLVDKQSDKYYVGDKSEFVLEGTYERAPGAEYQQVTWTWSTDTYFCDSYGLSTALPAETLANADAQLRLGQKAARVLVYKLMMAYEKRVAAKAFSSTYMTNNTDLTASKWDAAANTDILTPTQTAVEAVAGRIFQPANKMLVGRTVHNTILKNTNLRAYLYGDGPQGVPTNQQIADYFGVDEYYVGNVKYATAAGTVTDMWGKAALIYYQSPNIGETVDQEVSPMRTFVWNVDGNGRFQVSGPEFKRDHKGYKWYIDDYTGEKVISVDSAQLLYNLVA